jgi:hypothetical protein
MTNRLAIYALLAACLGLTALLYWELQPATADDMPVARSPTRGAAAITRVAARPPAATPSDLVATILARPLFVASRRPAISASDGGLVDGRLTDARLTGIVIEPGHPMALFAMPGPKILVLGQGGTVGDWHVERITPQDVALNGPTGTTTLRPRIDQNRPIPANPQPFSGNPAASRVARQQAVMQPQATPNPAAAAWSMARPMPAGQR